MANFWITTFTFGGPTHFNPNMRLDNNALSYDVPKDIVRLFYAWEYGLEPHEFLAGVIADAMTEVASFIRFTTPTHQKVWTRLRDYMRYRHSGLYHPDMEYFTPHAMCQSWLRPLESEMIEAKTQEKSQP